MARAIELACRDDLRRVGLPSQGPLARLLGLLRASPETHLTLSDVARLAPQHGLTAQAGELARQLDTLVEHGLAARLPSTGAEPVYDAVPEPHSHMIDEATGQTIDLDVSPETLLAMLRQALAEHPGQVELIIRVRREPAPAAAQGLPALPPAPATRRAGAARTR